MAEHQAIIVSYHFKCHHRLSNQMPPRPINTQTTDPFQIDTSFSTFCDYLAAV
jgi:hypothetical protein